MSDVFLTHDWGESLLDGKFQNHERVKVVNQYLQNDHQIHTWFDEERLTGDIRNKITEGLEQTKCLLVFITRKYHDKVNSTNPQDYCYFEFNFAIHILSVQRIIPVVMESEMTDTKLWRGRLAAEIGNHKYINLVDAFQNYEDHGDSSLIKFKCQEIAEEINRVINYPLRTNTYTVSTVSASSTSQTTQLNYKIRDLFDNPLKYTPELIVQKFKDLQNAILANSDLNEELEKIRFSDFYGKMLGFPDYPPLRAALHISLSVSPQVLYRMNESLLSILCFLLPTDDDMTSKKQYGILLDQRNLLLTSMTKCEATKVFIQLYNKYFRTGDCYPVIKQLILIMNQLQFWNEENRRVLLEQNIFRPNMVISFQDQYQCPFVELPSLFDIELLKCSYPLTDLIRNGVSLSFLVSKGSFTLDEFKDTKLISAKELSESFSFMQLRESYSINELLDGGFAIDELKINGVSINELISSQIQVRKFFPSSFTFEEMMNAGYDIKFLKEAGITLEELIAADPNLRQSYSISDLIAAGFTIVELKINGVSINELISSKIEVRKFFPSPFTLEEMMNAGYGIKFLKKAGITLKELIFAHANLRQLTQCYSADELNELIAGGREFHILKNNGVSINELISSKIEVRKFFPSPFTLEEMMNAGYGIKFLKEAGIALRELIMAGAELEELKKDFDVKALKAYFNLEKLKSQYNLRILTCSFSFTELRNEFSLSELIPTYLDIVFLPAPNDIAECIQFFSSIGIVMTFPILFPKLFFSHQRLYFIGSALFVPSFTHLPYTSILHFFYWPVFFTETILPGLRKR